MTVVIIMIMRITKGTRTALRTAAGIINNTENERYNDPVGALMMEAVSTSETSVNFTQDTQCNTSEHSHLRNRRRENVKSRLSYFRDGLYSAHLVNDS
jgi:hypothetical protein